MITLTRCESHQHNPPAADMADARYWTALLRAYSIPGAVADYMTHAGPPCCAAGAYARYLCRAAVRTTRTAEPSWSPAPSLPGLVDITAVIAQSAHILATYPGAIPGAIAEADRPGVAGITAYILRAAARRAVMGSE